MKAAFQTTIRQFDIFSKNAKRVLVANLIFGFIIPFYVIFSSTYIFVNSPDGNIEFNLLYSALTFMGNPIGFIMNGFLLRVFRVQLMFALGMLIIILNMATMMFLPPEMLTKNAILSFGLVSGVGSGVYWSSRTYLTVVSTKDEQRDFFSGLDYMFFIAGGIITPFIVGSYIGLFETGLFTRQFAYQSAMVFALVLVSIASFVVLRGEFSKVKVGSFLRYRFHSQWRKTRILTFIMGIYHGAILAIPAIFIMKYVGSEKTLGIVDSLTHMVALCAIYLVSRKSAVQDRAKVMLAGSVLFLLGTLLFGTLVSHIELIATLILIAAFYLSDPTMNYPYRATFMRSIDQLKKLEGRDEFTYIVDIEQFNTLGRMVSIGTFILLTLYQPEKIAFSTYIIAVAVIQFINIIYCKRINQI